MPSAAPSGIRPVVGSDLGDVPAWMHDFGLRADRWRDDDTRALVAIDGDRIVGTARHWNGRVHDSRLVLDVLVDPDRRREGIGTALVAAMAETRPDERPFSSVVEQGSAAEAFLRALGAIEYQRCPRQRLEVASALAVLHDAALPEGYRVVAASAVPRDELLQAHLDEYAWQHEGWAPLALDGLEWLARWFEPILDASRVVLDPSGRIAAEAFVWEIEGDVAQTTAETRTRDEPHGIALVASAMRTLLEALAVRGVATVQADGHVDDPHWAPVLSTLPAVGPAHVLLELFVGRSGTRAGTDRDLSEGRCAS